MVFRVRHRKESGILISCCIAATFPIILAMNMFPVSCASSVNIMVLIALFPQVGTRVFFWNGAGQTVYGTVQQAMRTADGTAVLNIRIDTTGQIVTLPAASVTKV
ncbi:hypothetical protein DFH06DRAFT_14202 [Mycena polygramma]|nr:hypothetical protein DFH06DRAFT_14202 [Mycena polygramma]